MSLIEGVGDEVAQFFGLVLVVSLGLIAWWSTSISDLPQIRTVLILERRSQTESQATLISQQPERADTATDPGPGTATDDKVDTHPSPVTPVSLPESNDPGDDSTPEEAAQEPMDEPTEDNIRIRLKYLNDDQKLVEGRLQELLGDFKRRHFSVELSREKRVRLIFNGQVLQSDDQTLQGCGLYDNCVVHCLVHTQQTTNRTGSTLGNVNTAPPEWNLSALLYICLSIILGFAWFCRYHYSQLFTLTTTAALVALTGMFGVSVVGLYVPDQEAAPA